MSDLFGNHIVVFSTRRLISLIIFKPVANRAASYNISFCTVSSCKLCHIVTIHIMDNID